MNDRLAAIDALRALPPGSTILLVGATDTGKTTFAVDAVNALLLCGRHPLAVVDADIGRSEIGPPGVVGLGSVQVTQPRPIPIRALSQISYLAGEFVGATSPVAHALELCSAALRLISSDAAANLKPDLALIDIPGLVTGAGAAYLRALLGVLRPNVVVAFARNGEIEPILRPPFPDSGNIRWRTGGDHVTTGG